METYLYYCPRCKYEKAITKIPENSLANCREGHGRPIYHSACPKCGNLDAGCIEHDFDYQDGDDERDDKYIISLYQNVRTTEPFYDWRKENDCQKM